MSKETMKRAVPFIQGRIRGTAVETTWEGVSKGILRCNIHASNVPIALQ